VPLEGAYDRLATKPYLLTDVGIGLVTRRHAQRLFYHFAEQSGAIAKRRCLPDKKLGIDGSPTSPSGLAMLLDKPVGLSRLGEDHRDTITHPPCCRRTAFHYPGTRCCGSVAR